MSHLSPVKPACFWLVVVFLFVVWRPPRAEVHFCSWFFTLLNLMAHPNNEIMSRPIVIVLRAFSPSYIPLLRPTLGWLLCPPLQWQPSKPKALSFSLFLFFGRSIQSSKQWDNISPPCYSPACGLPHLSPFAVTNLWLVVVLTHRVVAT
jgi:hypothetical protein